MKECNEEAVQKWEEKHILITTNTQINEAEFYLIARMETMRANHYDIEAHALTRLQTKMDSGQELKSMKLGDPTKESEINTDKIYINILTQE